MMRTVTTKNKRQKMQDTIARPYQAALSIRFMVTSFSVCCIIAFSVGRIARLNLILEEEMKDSYSHNPRLAHGRHHGITLPTPLAKEGKPIPETIYTTRNFDTRGSATILSQWLKPDPNYNVPEPVNERLVDIEINDTDSTFDLEDNEEEHLPAGQHLLVDIDNIDASFLDSEEKLATAMVNLVDNSGLTLLSYHCHGLTPAGVSCAGVLLESHVSFHTWPAEGVITLDLFTCGSTSLLNSLKLIEDLFAIPRSGSEHVSPTVLWAYKRRGFKDQLSKSHNQPGSQKDTFAYPLGIHGLEYKTEVAATEISPGKHAYIYDLIQRPYQSVDSYFKSLSSSKDTYESTFPDLFLPNRLFYYDGVLKSSRLGKAAAYESFVHPAMFAHDDPKRILILGAGAGGSLREVLKHKSVEHVTLLGADQALVNFAREHLESWNDCSDLVGRSRPANCFDDPRVDINYQGVARILSEYSTSRTFDVAIVDFAFIDDLTESKAAMHNNLVKSLTDVGVAVFHVSNDRLADLPVTKHNGSRASRHEEYQGNFVMALEEAGFEAFKDYKEMQPGFPEPRTYVLAFKDSDYVHNWFSNEAQVSQQIRSRSVETKNGKSAFLFFDGSKMTSYSKFSMIETDISCDGGRHRPLWCEQDTIKGVYESNMTNKDVTCNEARSCNLAGDFVSDANEPYINIGDNKERSDAAI